MRTPPDQDIQLQDDPMHAIPLVFHCDGVNIKKTGGADLHIVIASELGDDDQSLNRLLKKLENYLRLISSADFRSLAGSPNIDNTRIKVSIHPKSSQAAFELLFKCHEWVRSNGATLEVADLEDVRDYSLIPH